MSLLSLDRVSKRFNGVPAVDDVSFTVDRGQVVGFLGPNGAGKSTTMRMITQYFEPDGGTIRLDGTPLAEAGREAKRRIGYLPESNPLYPEMLVSEWLDYIASLREIRGSDRRPALDEAIAATATESVYHRPIGELSKGFRQRVGLAAAILHRPDLLVLDSPPLARLNQRIEIRRLIAVASGATVVLSTHVLPEVIHPLPAVDHQLGRRRRRASGGAGLPARGECRITVEAAGLTSPRGSPLPGAGVIPARARRAGAASPSRLRSDDLRPRISTCQGLGRPLRAAPEAAA
jgi:ABC-type Na+ transport system ATPase subunit NatA